MSLRVWAIKPGELRPLSRRGLVLLAARCAMRVEPWAPRADEKSWASHLAFAVAGAVGDPAGAKEVARRSRALSSRGVTVEHRLASTDDALGRCAHYALWALASAVEVAGCSDRAPAAKAVVGTAKIAASIPAIWAHAGRVRARDGRDVVDRVCTTTWAAIRRDIEHVAAREADVADAPDPARALLAVAPLWPGAAPSWSRPPRRP